MASARNRRSTAYADCAPVAAVRDIRIFEHLKEDRYILHHERNRKLGYRLIASQVP
jgi:hypothetical protein